MKDVKINWRSALWVLLKVNANYVSLADMFILVLNLIKLRLAVYKDLITMFLNSLSTKDPA